MTHHTNEKIPRACDSEGLDIDTSNDLNYATGARHQIAEALQIAQLVRAGHAVHKGNNGDYLVCNYGMSRHCQDFDALRAFAKRVGVCHDTN